ncbi:sensor histidine kinase [Pyxidicoccus xibeiensis]|uniref:sensor histidine kinase n=1 Tax=Pyxidicoccus xibeiensis TaxID=2906759 RepID=UPI0020A8302B|nr:GAF domain-containing protein [Pyxidicoccus xibeiensis]MCP3137231.1 GAF domain-containing protein [Pyxidicoccus xibeiensis]
MKMPESNLVAAVDRMSRALERLAAAPPVVAVLEELLRQASATLGAPGAFICWWGDAGCLRTLVTPDVPEDPAAICAQRLLERAPGPSETPRPYVAVDLEADALLADEPEARRRLGAGALLSLPIFFSAGRGAAGVLVVVFREARGMTDEDIKRFGLYARLAGLALERERMVENTRQSVLQARAEVEQAEVQRLSRIQTVTEAFGRALTRDEVARVVLELGLPAVGAVGGMVHLLDAGGTAVELTASVGVPEELVAPMRVLPRGGKDLPGYEAVRTGAPVWLESADEVRTRYPRLAPLVASGRMRSLVLLPLYVEGRIFGTLGFGFAEAKRFSALERTSITGLARQCGQALERSRLYERERTARLQAEAAGRRLRLLADASALVAGSLEWEETVAGVARLALGTFADGCTVDSFEDGVVRRLAVLHADAALAPGALELMRAAPEAPHSTLLAEVLATGRSRMMTRASVQEPKARAAGAERAWSGEVGRAPGVEEAWPGEVGRAPGAEAARPVEVVRAPGAEAARPVEVVRAPGAEAERAWSGEVGRAPGVEQPQAGGSTHAPGSGEGSTGEAAHPRAVGSLLLTPLVARQRTLGALTFVRGEEQPPFDDADLALGEELAGRAALAIDNARLLRKARVAEEESRRSAARLHILVQVSQLIAEAGLDLPTVLDVLARKVSEAIGDACVLQLLSADREHLEVVSIHHPDPQARGVLEESLWRCPPQVGEGLSGRVAATGQTLFVPRLTAQELHGERLPECVSFLERYGPQSVIIAPLGARGRVLGTLAVMREAQGREYTLEERALLESLAARAALAIEDARLYGAATQAVRARDELLSVAGHELKSPLNALQLQIHLLARMAKEAMAASGLAERAEKAARASQRLGLLIDDLLDVSRISAGRLSLQCEEVDLSALARELVSRMSEELVRAGSEVRMSLDGPVTGHWDRLRLEQVLVNLLSNAAKYGAGRPVMVSVDTQGPVARLVVRDEGIGVPPEDQERIFERFERSASVQHFKGLGLGLWITKRIVEAHGGSIRVESQPGAGSTFTVELPLGGGRISSPRD